ncbi:MAG: acetylxylan esterase, partial [Verrucomicrobia bacterium]|nr:acetylxylan esterase [Verrucomicrobiota bacterium]
TLQEPGFLRCRVTLRHDGARYEGIATAGFSIDEIKPTVPRPADFLEFWDHAKAELAKVPIDARLRPIPESSTGNAEVFEVNLQNWGFAGSSRLYGILSLPKAPGRHPALLVTPGAGVRGMATDPDPLTTDHGVIVLKIDIHGLPLTLPPEVYASLDMTGLRMYWNYNIEHRDRYYYKRAYLGCIRANDFLATLPQFDGANLLVSGRSQGGALSIVTASLDRRVRYLFCGFPALCDLTGYLHGRAGGWPPSVHARAGGMFHNASPATLATLPYYDVVNFARELRVPGLYSWGFNDTIVPPTSMHAAYNVIAAPKELLLYPESGHWQYPELAARRDAWLRARLFPQ